MRASAALVFSCKLVSPALSAPFLAPSSILSKAARSPSDQYQQEEMAAFTNLDFRLLPIPMMKENPSGESNF